MLTSFFIRQYPFRVDADDKAKTNTDKLNKIYEDFANDLNKKFLTKNIENRSKVFLLKQKNNRYW